MSKRVRINHRRLVAMRKQPALVAKLTVLGMGVLSRANADFQVTASDDDREIQAASTKPAPYDMSVRVGRDRVRVYVQTASLAARRHERSVRGSSLLRAARG